MIKRFHTHLTDKKKLTDDMYLLTYSLEPGQELEFLPGQYMISLIPQSDGKLIRRLYSIASSPQEKNSFQLFIKAFPNGVGSNYLTQMSVGGEVDFDGPAGIFTLKETEHDKTFLATGTGLAPMRSMLTYIKNNTDWQKAHQNTKLNLFWGVAHLKDVCLVEELKALQKLLPNFDYCICVSRETTLDLLPESERVHYVIGRITAGIDQHFEKVSQSEFNICGNRDVVDTMKNHLYEKGVPKEKVHFEKF